MTKRHFSMSGEIYALQHKMNLASFSGKNLKNSLKNTLKDVELS